MVEIPKAFQNPNFRFIPNRSKSKLPIVTRWTTDNSFPFDDKRILEYRGNIGIVLGNGLICFDCDTQQAENIARQLPETLVIGSSIKAGGYRGKHFYFYCEGVTNRLTLEDYGKHLGEVQTNGQQMIIPPSVHETGILYEILEDKPIALVELKELSCMISPFIKTEPTTKRRKEDKDKEEKDPICAEVKSKLSVSQVLNDYGIDVSKNPTMCPLGHTSQGQKCFSFNDDRNIWYCFHCNKGGSLFDLVMEKEKVTFPEAKDILADKVGLDTKTKQNCPYFNKDGQFISKLLADELIRELNVKCTSDNYTYFIYKQGMYVEGESVVLARINRKLGKLFKKNLESETMAYLRGATITDRTAAINPNILNCKNGLVDLTTGNLQPHNPDVFTVMQIPIEYNPNADCPIIKQFLKQIVKSKDVTTIQEMIGYCLYADYPLHKVFILIGEGQNGKSTLIDTVVHFLGTENVKSIPLQNFEEDQFAKAELFGKLANICADISDDALMRTGTIKQLTGNDNITAPQKYKKSIDFRNFAKQIYSCNRLPQSKDETDAFFRRFIYLIFPNIFDEKKRDVNLLRKLTTDEEMSGLLNYAIQGLQTILQNGRFTNEPSIAEVREMHQRLSSPIVNFIVECTSDDPNGEVIKSEMYAAFIQHCMDKRMPTMSEKGFFMSIRQHKPLWRTEHPTREMKDGSFDRVWIFKGCRFKTNEEQKAEELLED